MSGPPIRVGHPDQPRQDGLCGCCEGTALSTLQPIWNRPNLTAITYRVGEHARFKASMLTALASAEHDVLRDLGTRDDDDFTIALIDAWAAVCEVLSFYQERHANEAYLQTARERLSIGEIAQLIGYRLHPGSAAETNLVFVMDDPPGAEPTVADLTIPAGTRVQSQPGPDETPQVFETVELLRARVAWNKLRARQFQRLQLERGDDHIWLAGDAAGLRSGDAVLLVGRRRSDPTAPDYDPGSENWDFRFVKSVEAHPDLQRTKVEFDRPLGSTIPLSDPARYDHQFFVFRQRASLFGYNAPHPSLLPDATVRRLVSAGLIAGTIDAPGDWAFRLPGRRQIALDGVYSGFVEGSWVVLASRGYRAELYKVVMALDDGRAQYGISGRSTLLTLDIDENLDKHEARCRTVSVYGAGEEIEIADAPIREWVAGHVIDLDGRTGDLPEERRLIVTGRRAQVVVAAREIAAATEDGPASTLSRGTRLTLMAAPESIPGETDLYLWKLAQADGSQLTATAKADDLAPVKADDATETVAEIAVLDRVEADGPSHSRLVLTSALKAAYDRATMAVHANVARASHGEAATEILGGGEPSRAFQSFRLKQNPVTHRVAATENGVASTIKIRVDGVTWREVPDLFSRGAGERIFATRLTDDGETVVRFGDGRSGARPPAGRDNIVADYRVGLGRAGNVRPGQLSLPLDRPLGLKEVTNHLPATGGDDPEAAEGARRNAPNYTLTFGRVVSITDYRDFALAYPGIAKADARWVWDGESRRIVVTVAGPGGAEIAKGGPTYPALLEALRRFGDPFVRFDLISHAPALFRIGLSVAVDPAHQTDAVLAAVEAALRARFAFEARDFAQPVALSRVVEIVHRVPGVRAADIDRLYRTSAPQTSAEPHSLLAAQTGRLGAEGSILPAEVLTISPEPFDALEVMP